MKNQFWLLMAVGLCLVATGAMATTIAKLDRIDSGELMMVGVELTKAGEVNIEAVGMSQMFSDKLAVYGWLLDSKTRKPVWTMKVKRTSRKRGGNHLRSAEKTTFLEKGKYELYFYAVDQWYRSATISGLKDLYTFLDDMNEDEDDYDDYDSRDWDRDLDECFVRLTSDELAAGDFNEFEITGESPDALVQFNELGDDEYIQQGFRVDAPMNIRIYAIVEHPRGNRTPVDYGWIIDSETRKKVWEMDRWNTERAGGGRKNRKFDDELFLEAGTYVLHFVTDGSHSWDGFNTSPPYDPVNWGISLFPGNEFKASAFSLTDSPETAKPLIDFTRARDNDYFEQAFELKEATSVQIVAIGEYSRSDHGFVDYGWIEEAGNSRTVWEMKKSNTEHAGGGEKNRMFDGWVKLKAGRYVVSYATDDSHAYRDWNTSQPYNSRAYGLAMYGGPDFDDSKFALVDNDAILAESGVLAQMIRVRDREHRRDKFTLDKDTRVNIYALGEGERRSMYDFGWIIDDATGRTVWEMTMRNTDPAGGADKNRVFDDEIELDAGTYVVFYETDGSHSFNDWNASPPRHPKNWGVTVTRTD